VRGFFGFWIRNGAYPHSPRAQTPLRSHRWFGYLRQDPRSPLSPVTLFGTLLSLQPLSLFTIVEQTDASSSAVAHAAVHAADMDSGLLPTTTGRACFGALLHDEPHDPPCHVSVLVEEWHRQTRSRPCPRVWHDSPERLCREIQSVGWWVWESRTTHRARRCEAHRIYGSTAAARGEAEEDWRRGEGGGRSGREGLPACSMAREVRPPRPWGPNLFCLGSPIISPQPLTHKGSEWA